MRLDVVRQDQAVVLVRHTRLLLPALRAARKPEIGNRGRAKPFFGQRQQAACHHIGHVGDHTGDDIMAVAGGDQLHQQFGDTGGDPGQILNLLCAGGLRHQPCCRGCLETRQVGLRDNSDQPPGP